MTPTPARTKRRRIAAAVAGLAVIAGAAWLTVDRFRERREAELYDRNIGEMLTLAALPQQGPFDDRIDRIRSFINDHSRHLMDGEFYAMHGDRGGNSYLEKIIAHAKGETSDPAHMDCSTRSIVMRNLLMRLGYEVRILSVFDTADTSKSHTFLDVKDPATGKWQTQDPDFDLYWVSTRTGERVSLAEQSGDLAAIVPCSPSHCGWDNRGRDGQRATLVRKWLDIVTVTRKESDTWYGLYTPRADLSAQFHKNGRSGTFCEVQDKRCKDGFGPIADHAKLEKQALE